MQNKTDYLQNGLKYEIWYHGIHEFITINNNVFRNVVIFDLRFAVHLLFIFIRKHLYKHKCTNYWQNSLNTEVAIFDGISKAKRAVCCQSPIRSLKRDYKGSQHFLYNQLTG